MKKHLSLSITRIMVILLLGIPSSYGCKCQGERTAQNRESKANEQNRLFRSGTERNNNRMLLMYQNKTSKISTLIFLGLFTAFFAVFLILCCIDLIEWHLNGPVNRISMGDVSLAILMAANLAINVFLFVMVWRDRFTGGKTLFSVLLSGVILYVLLFLSCKWSSPGSDDMWICRYVAPHWLGGANYEFGSIHAFENTGMGKVVGVILLKTIGGWAWVVTFSIVSITANFWKGTKILNAINLTPLCNRIKTFSRVATRIILNGLQIIVIVLFILCYGYSIYSMLSL